jgi:predicted nucleic acid-binding protein
VIVVDASTLIELLLRSPHEPALTRRLLAPGATLHAPHLIDAEIAQVLRRFAVRGELDAERGREALEDLADLGLRRYPHRRLLPRIWELRHNLTAYDAAYVALAEALGAPLVTRDRRLAAAAGTESHAAIEVV